MLGLSKDSLSRFVRPESATNFLPFLDIMKKASPIISQTIVVDGKKVELEPIDFTSGIDLTAPVDKTVYTNDWTASLEKNIKYLLEQKKIETGGVTCEVGCYEGKGTNLISKLLKPRFQICIDPWDDSYIDEGLKSIKFKNQWEMFNNNIDGLPNLAIRRGTSDDILPMCDVLDFIYIDGDHTYEQVVRDLNNAYQRLNKGGICLVDDYVWISDNPVRKAVDEFLDSHDNVRRVTLADDRQVAFRCVL